jgi:hypothetical protein
MHSSLGLQFTILTFHGNLLSEAVSLPGIIDIWQTLLPDVRAELLQATQIKHQDRLLNPHFSNQVPELFETNTTM